MTFIEASSESVYGFVGILLFVSGSFVIGAYFADKGRFKTLIQAAVGLAGYFLLVAAYVKSGIFERFPLASIPIFFGGANVTALWFAFSSLGKKLAFQLPLPALVAFQAFRLPLELVLHSWTLQGTIPETMTWTGSNFDIISGIFALILAPFSRWSKWPAWIANLVGLVLLLNVMRVAVLSSPLPFGWNVQPPLLLALYLPYAWIGPICVGGALAGHVILTRALLGRRSGR